MNKRYKNKYRKNYGGKLSWVGNDRESIFTYIANVINETEKNNNSNASDTKKEIGNNIKV